MNNHDEVPIPTEQDLTRMGCPAQIASEVRRELEQTPPNKRVTMGQIQRITEGVMNRNPESVQTGDGG